MTVEYYEPRQESIELTDSAATKIQALIEEEHNPDLFLRIYITGGGCSGLQYGFTLDNVVNETDIVIEKALDDLKVRVVVDAISLQYLSGAKVDYTEDASGEQFIIHNPNAKTKCGCGSSFSVDED